MKLLNWLRPPYKPQKDYLKESVEKMNDAIDRMGQHAGVGPDGKMKATERMLEHMNNNEILKSFGEALDNF